LVKRPVTADRIAASHGTSCFGTRWSGTTVTPVKQAATTQETGVKAAVTYHVVYLLVS